MYAGERFNAITHLVGAILALAGSVTLIVLAAASRDPWKIVAASTYGASLLVLYTSSTLYHSLRGQAKCLFRELDHHSIYVLIAGSYTPFCLVTLRGPWGSWLLGGIWGLAILGSLQEFWPRNEARVRSVVLYAAMGWAMLVAVLPLWRALGPSGCAWVLAGGLAYTLGIVFYALDTRLAHAHGVWHLFVVAGSAAHYVAIVRFVI
jgi:hemolysin III